MPMQRDVLSIFFDAGVFSGSLMKCSGCVAIDIFKEYELELLNSLERKMKPLLVFF